MEYNYSSYAILHIWNCLLPNKLPIVKKINNTMQFKSNKDALTLISLKSFPYLIFKV